MAIKEMYGRSEIARMAIRGLMSYLIVAGAALGLLSDAARAWEERAHVRIATIMPFTFQNFVRGIINDNAFQIDFSLIC